MKRLFSILTATALALVLALPARAASETVDSSMAPSGMALVGDTLYVADTYHRAVWTVEDGEASLLAGRTEITDLSGRPVEGYNDGTFAQAAFSEPWAIVPYDDGFLVSDTGNHVLRYLNMDKERVYTAAGTGRAGLRDDTGEKASFDSPTGLAVDNEGTVYIADTGNNVIRCMDEDGNVTTYAGGEEGCALGSLQTVRFSQPTGLCWADGVLYVADTGNHRIVALDGNQAVLAAGAELTGDAAYEGDFLNGTADTARFSSPQGIAVGQDGTVYIADTGNGAVRVLKDGYVTTLLEREDNGTYPVFPRGLLVNGDTLYVGDVFSRVLLRSDARVEGISFLDVREDSWYAPAVYFAAANSLFTGTGDGLFSPDAPMTRAMVLTVLARYDGVNTAGGDSWYAAGLQWGLDTGVSDGTSPMSPITREQLAVMLYRYVQYRGVDVSGAWMYALEYADAGAVSDYAYEAMCWMNARGIITGVGDNRLAPQGTATRAQVAAILMRCLSYGGE